MIDWRGVPRLMGFKPSLVDISEL